MSLRREALGIWDAPCTVACMLVERNLIRCHQVSLESHAQLCSRARNATDMIYLARVLSAIKVCDRVTKVNSSYNVLAPNNCRDCHANMRRLNGNLANQNATDDLQVSILGRHSASNLPCLPEAREGNGSQFSLVPGRSNSKTDGEAVERPQRVHRSFTPHHETFLRKRGRAKISTVTSDKPARSDLAQSGAA
jgi:hypothetical protein